MNQDVANLNLPQFVSDLEKAGHGSGANAKLMGESSKGLQEQEALAMFILTDTLPVIAAKLVKRIQKGKFVDMAELLKDNIEAERRRLAVEENSSSHNPRREIPTVGMMVAATVSHISPSSTAAQPARVIIRE